MTAAIVTGSRTGTPTVLQLAKLAHDIGYYGVDRVLVGCCTGVDQKVARCLATTDLDVIGYPAYFSQLGWARDAYRDGILTDYTFPREVAEAAKKIAGPLRNALMAKLAGPDGILFAFPGGRGTASMKAQARKVGMRVLAWNAELERFAEEGR